MAIGPEYSTWNSLEEWQWKSRKNLNQAIENMRSQNYQNYYVSPNQWFVTQGEWGIPEVKEKIPMSLSSMMKRLLDKDTQTLVKAGCIDSNLELTEIGRKALWAIIFVANKAELVKLAQEKLDEEKDN